MVCTIPSQGDPNGLTPMGVHSVLALWLLRSPSLDSLQLPLPPSSSPDSELWWFRRVDFSGPLHVEHPESKSYVFLRCRISYQSGTTNSPIRRYRQLILQGAYHRQFRSLRSHQACFFVVSKSSRLSSIAHVYTPRSRSTSRWRRCNHNPELDKSRVPCLRVFARSHLLHNP